jgi:two-component system chemotaxis response regulator CheY
MPRLDGRQLIAHIRGQSSQRHVPVIMVTTEFDPQKLAAVHQLGVSAICNKSFQRSLVRNVVIQLFAKLAH